MGLWNGRVTRDCGSFLLKEYTCIIMEKIHNFVAFENFI